MLYEVITHLRSGYGHVDVVFQDGEDCEISGRRSSLYEMLLNLVINAVDAMPDGGEIGISTSRMNGTVILEVRDSGTGMTEEVRKKCLEPFFTSKGNRGTGIGLMMVNNIVQDHSGKLEIESAPVITSYSIHYTKLYEMRFRFMFLQE